MGIKPASYQKLFELVTCTESCIVDFTGANKHFSFFTISLVYDESDQHRSIHNSYNTQLASTRMKSITLENATNTYSTFNSMKFDTSDLHNKFLLYNQFVVQYCKGCSIAPLSDYANNPVFQELHSQSKYFTFADKKIFIDLRCGKGYTNKIKKLNRNDRDLAITIQLKTAAMKRIRLCITWYYQGEYLYSMRREGLMNYKYRVNKQEHAIS